MIMISNKDEWDPAATIVATSKGFDLRTGCID